MSDEEPKSPWMQRYPKHGDPRQNRDFHIMRIDAQVRELLSAILSELQEMNALQQRRR